MKRMLRNATRLLTLAALAACGNAGADRTVGITATGSVRGAMFLDANGSGTRDAGDLAAVGVRVALVTPLRRDTLRRATTDANGDFDLGAVPVGSYEVVLDPASVGDSVEVQGVDGVQLTLAPDQALELTGRLAYPRRTALQLRSDPLGRRVFLEGVALHGYGTYSDTLLHVTDTTGALRAARVRPSVVSAGDSVRLRGRIAERDGQRVLDDVTVFILGGALLPTSPVVTTQQAANASAGALDAAIVRLFDVPIIDTATVLGSLRLEVNDGSGPLTVVLDRVADAAFRPPFLAGQWDAGERFDFVGVLVPLAPGTWALRPRNAFDLTPR